MIAPRRFLPSIPSLLALEAVDRLGSAVAAAEDLSLTHSAVSRQLKVLEEQLGVTLLVREGKGLALTPAGARYAASVRDILEDLAQASLRLRARGSRGSLNLALPPSFGLYWMGPKLHAFMAEHPQILVNQSTRLSRFDFGREKFDAAVHFGPEDWPGTEALPLARDRVIPVCAPSLAADLPPGDPAALLSLPLLHLESRAGAWESWFDAHGVAPGQLRGLLFDQFFAMAEASAAGFGLALLPEFLARPEIDRGRLVAAWPDYLDQGGIYSLVWPRNQAPEPALQRFIDWMAERAEL